MGRHKTPLHHRRGGILLGIGAAAAIALGVGALILTRPFAEPPWPPAMEPGGADGPGLPDRTASPEPPRPARPGQPAPSVAAGRDPGATDLLVSPFHIGVDPMEALLLVNFEGDPDRIYVSFEPQRFDDARHGTGLIVLGWRVDGRVDVFHEPGLRMDPATFGIAGGGLHVMAERDLGPARMVLGPAGVDAAFTFEDLEGRRVHLVVRETDPAPRTHFGLLAPMGSATLDPPALPLVFVDEFSFVRRRGSEVRVEIDGRNHRTDPIPLLVDGARVHFIRYSTAPFIARLNPDEEVALRVLGVADAEPLVDDAGDTLRILEDVDGVQYTLVEVGGRPAIRSFERRDGEQAVVVELHPAFPDLLALADGEGRTGAFRVRAQPAVGTVTGTWRVARAGDRLRIEMIPDGGWTPGPGPRLVRLLFRMVPIFRNWPATYRWSAEVALGDAEVADAREGAAVTVPGARLLQAGWERIEP